MKKLLSNPPSSGRPSLRLARPGLLLVLLAALPLPALADNGDLPRGKEISAEGHWAVMAGTSLKSTLESWSRSAGWSLIWDSPVDYRLRASVSFPGGFEESAARLIDSIYQSNPELIATFHRGNKVLHIQDQPLSSN